MARFRESPFVFLVSAIVVGPLFVGGLAVSFAYVTSHNNVAPTASPSVEPTGEDEPDVIPTLVPGGTAEQNKPFFDYLNKQTIALTATPAGQTFIDALAAAGFDRGSMQLTPDNTAAGLQADSIQFSVQIGDQCLIGQWGTGSKGYKSMIAPVVPGIGCLIGETRPIDW